MPKIPKPRRGRGSTQPKAGHTHNDNGRQYEKGGKLYTHCTCGALVAVDDVTDDDDE